LTTTIKHQKLNEIRKNKKVIYHLIFEVKIFTLQPAIPDDPEPDCQNESKPDGLDGNLPETGNDRKEFESEGEDAGQSDDGELCGKNDSLH
jgi:hypothetical protein